jgi:hypothetical protein
VALVETLGAAVDHPDVARCHFCGCLCHEDRASANHGDS